MVFSNFNDNPPNLPLALTSQKRVILISHNFEVMSRGAWDVTVAGNAGGYYLDDRDVGWNWSPIFFDRELAGKSHPLGRDFVALN